MIEDQRPWNLHALFHHRGTFSRSWPVHVRLDLPGLLSCSVYSGKEISPPRLARKQEEEDIVVDAGTDRTSWEVQKQPSGPSLQEKRRCDCSAPSFKHKSSKGV